MANEIVDEDGGEDCYDARWCPNGDCEICDFRIDGISGWPFVWAKVTQFFVRLWRRDFRAGRVK